MEEARLRCFFFCLLFYSSVHVHCKYNFGFRLRALVCANDSLLQSISRVCNEVAMIKQKIVFDAGKTIGTCFSLSSFLSNLFIWGAHASQKFRCRLAMLLAALWPYAPA